MSTAPTRAVVDLGRIAANIRALRALCAPGVLQMAVVKADGYGHGAVPVARAALEAGATWLGVALTAEGRALRAAGIGAPILLLGSPLPEAAPEIVEAGLTASVCTAEFARALDRAAAAAGRVAEVHLELDTGMGRVGVPAAEAVAFADFLGGLPHLALGGVYSHLATADEADLGPTHRQCDAFEAALGALAARGVRVPLAHLANTAGTLALPRSHHGLVRTGIGIYGLYPSAEAPRAALLAPALSLVTRVAQIKWVAPGTPLSYGGTHVTPRPTRVATLPVGYADGYPRLLSNRGAVLVGGRRAPVLGRVCMDMTLVDVTDRPETALGDEVVLLGEQGGEAVTADELAGLTGTISYEITCGIGQRVPREYRPA